MQKTRLTQCIHAVAAAAILITSAGCAARVGASPPPLSTPSATAAKLGSATIGRTHDPHHPCFLGHCSSYHGSPTSIMNMRATHHHGCSADQGCP